MMCVDRKLIRERMFTSQISKMVKQTHRQIFVPILSKRCPECRLLFAVLFQWDLVIPFQGIKDSKELDSSW